MTVTTTPDLDIDRCRKLVDDLRAPLPWVYLSDAAASAILGWLLFWVAALDGLLWIRVGAFAVSGLALYRALAFIHELFHQQSLTGLRHFWHATAGVPLLLPLLLYQPVHQAHHNARTYGTPADGEYEQFRGRLAASITKLFGLNLALPIALIVRFGVLTPLSFVVPAVRREVIPRFLHMALRFPYQAPELNAAWRREAMVVELACMVWAWGLVALLATGHVRVVALWAAMILVISTLNTLRAICSTHLYVEESDGRNALGQLRDSINVGGGALTELLCPTGLRYHALHHIAPYLPYHRLAQAHRRLMTDLPAGSDYHQATTSGLRAGWRRLVDATAGG